MLIVMPESWKSPVAGVASCVLTLLFSIMSVSAAQGANAQLTEVETLRAEVAALQALLPSQSHAMADVDYHFSNLWFAAQHENWPLAEFYLNETRSHLRWAVRIRPVRKLTGGGAVELAPMLQHIEGSGLTALRAALAKHDGGAFRSAYQQTMSECLVCHRASEKSYLIPHIPEAPASRIIDFRPETSKR